MLRYLAYAIGRVLPDGGAPRGAVLADTFHIPIAPGDRRDPMHAAPGAAGHRQRPLPIAACEPFAEFEARARATLEREARGEG
ncbi:MAG: hypothetical protein KIT31_21595 [Deltaproteobacteria bacterium]|nr:hypothetical protein [Deltaproteobacteria bacterium]